MMPATFWGLIWAKNKCIAASFLPELQGKGNIYSKLLGSLLLSDCIWTSWRHRQGLNWLCILPRSHIWEKFGNGNPLQYSCHRESRGWRSLVGCSPWGRKESDTTEWLHFTHLILSHRWGNDGNSEKLHFLGLQNHCRW